MDGAGGTGQVDASYGSPARPDQKDRLRLADLLWWTQRAMDPLYPDRYDGIF